MLCKLSPVSAFWPFLKILDEAFSKNLGLESKVERLEGAQTACGMRVARRVAEDSGQSKPHPTRSSFASLLDPTNAIEASSICKVSQINSKVN